MFVRQKIREIKHQSNRSPNGKEQRESFATASGLPVEMVYTPDEDCTYHRFVGCE